MRCGSPPGTRARRYLSRRQKFAVYGVLGTLWGSGVLWLIVHYFLFRHGPFGAEPNPSESWWLALHGACGFASLWLGGWLWSVHVAPWWRSGLRRRSGMLLIGLAGWLIVSGYLLYYAGNDTLRRWIVPAHWIVGLLLALPLLVHAWRSRHYRHAMRAKLL